MCRYVSYWGGVQTQYKIWKYMGLENEANVEVRYTLLYLKPISGKIWGCKKTSGPLQDYRLDLSLWSFYYNDRTIDKKKKRKRIQQRHHHKHSAGGESLTAACVGTPHDQGGQITCFLVLQTFLFEI